MFRIILLILIFQKCLLSTDFVRRQHVYQAICFYPKDEGYGNDTMEKFYYHAVYGRCMRFTYRGAGGNDNNFDAEDVCEKMCKSSGTFDRSDCQQPHHQKSCFDYFQHHYFDSNSEHVNPMD
uniref:BPTI/Kunitz inhibitor domain-containing protein n=1 Tax=Trichobilharzia regenti TaxID=157069 RepID=A0AA85K5G0_TRIRE|nr:unnamed protein product [Trichobilharzia regenti]